MTTATVIRNVAGTSTGDAFYDAEASAEDSEPRELVEISINDGVTIYRHTSATRDIVYAGERYTAIALARDAVMVTMPSESSNDVSLSLPIDHALCRRYTQQATPPKKIAVAIRRQNGGATEIVWAGFITSMAAEGRIARFRVPSRAGEWMLRTLPTATVGRKCPWVVYSDACGVSRTGSHGGLAFRVSTTVISVVGRKIRVDLGSTDRNGTWAEGGEVVHAATGERMTVGLQEDANPGVSGVADLTMQMAIIGLTAGNSVDIYRGCALTVADCETGFGNRQNFGGMPQMPTGNPFLPEGAGSDGL